MPEHFGRGFPLPAAPNPRRINIPLFKREAGFGRPLALEGLTRAISIEQKSFPLGQLGQTRLSPEFDEFGRIQERNVRIGLDPQRIPPHVPFSRIAIHEGRHASRFSVSRLRALNGDFDAPDARIKLNVRTKDNKRVFPKNLSLTRNRNPNIPLEELIVRALDTFNFDSEQARKEDEGAVQILLSQVMGGRVSMKETQKFLKSPQLIGTLFWFQKRAQEANRDAGLEFTEIFYPSDKIIMKMMAGKMK